MTKVRLRQIICVLSAQRDKPWVPLSFAIYGYPEYHLNQVLSDPSIVFLLPQSNSRPTRRHAVTANASARLLSLLLAWALTLIH